MLVGKQYPFSPARPKSNMDEIEITIDHNALSLKPAAMTLRDAFEACQSLGDEEPATESTGSGSGGSEGSSAGCVKINESTKEEENEEVIYQDGATPLFNAIVESNWKEALRIIRGSPDQVRIWVKSIGTQNTTFEWSVWKRLPVHEACRKQAPAWIISALLSSFPGSAKCATDFGELPLHLAVSCGASPEVVNLVLVSNVEGIASEDRSGRTPVDVWDQSEYLVDDEHRVVCESLKRCQETYNLLQRGWQSKLDNLKKQHETTLLALRHQHDQDLSRETNRKNELATENDKLYDIVEKLNGENYDNKKKIQTLEQTKQSNVERVENLSKQVTKLKAEKAEEQENVEALHQLIEDKDEEIHSLSTKVRKLTKDMQHVMAWYEDTEQGLAQTQKDLQKMVDSYVKIHDKLSKEKETIQSVITKRGIEMPAKKFPGGPAPPPPPRTPSRSQGMEIHEGEIAMGEAADAAVAAASAALTRRRNISSPDL